MFKGAKLTFQVLESPAAMSTELRSELYPVHESSAAVSTES
jgi:hypothetical protein